jgi:hypothetical protein
MNHPVFLQRGGSFCFRNKHFFKFLVFTVNELKDQHLLNFVSELFSNYLSLKAQNNEKKN